MARRYPKRPQQDGKRDKQSPKRPQQGSKRPGPATPRKTPKGSAVVVNGYSEGWLKQGFPWVYPAEVVARPHGLKPGKRVSLADARGEHLGEGIWDEGFVAVRRFRTDKGPIDRALLDERIVQAQALRDAVVEHDTTAYRLVNGENDGLPGVRVDVYGHYAVISLDSPSLEGLLGPLCDVLEQRLGPRGIHLAWRPDPREPEARAVVQQAGPLRGHPAPSDIRVTERGVGCLVRPGAGKDIGLYTDMRSNRAWLEPTWGGQRLLNLFAHTGMFSVCAAMAGATETVSVDLSEAYLDRAQANFRTNQLDPDQHTFIEGDVRRVLDRFRRTDERFGRVLLDPPSFSHGPEGVLATKRDYPRLVSASLRVTEPDGWFIGALNLGEVNPRDFHGMVRDGARKAGRRLQLLFEGGQAPDHPAAVDWPEGRYLKFGVWRVY